MEINDGEQYAPVSDLLAEKYEIEYYMSAGRKKKYESTYERCMRAVIEVLKTVQVYVSSTVVVVATRRFPPTAHADREHTQICKIALIACTNDGAAVHGEHTV